MTPAKVGKMLKELYNKLWEAFGPQGWWPGETPFEVALGAILTQNTNWGNVARAIAALRERHLLEPQALHDLPETELAQLIRPAGYYNIKARRVKNFSDLLQGQYDGSMEVMADGDLEDLRHRLLEVKGIGPETADSILLYALNKPTFVVDAYTFRILSRHQLLPEVCAYEELRGLFMDHLAADVGLYQEYHALLVRLGKEYCRPQPRCDSCFLQGWPE
ncbi:MAG: endonuclease III domain-containing protein [Deltaproteobacteria bacterium]|nr:endonuclease III domain-containing protein [Deltaproteobacteria bacterium]